MDNSEYTFRSSESSKKLRRLKLQVTDSYWGPKSKYRFKGKIDNFLEPIPKEVFLLKNLQELDLSSDRVSGIYSHIFFYLPPEISNFKRLKMLNLGSNNFRKLPNEIGELTQLEIGIFSNNRISELPETFVKLKNLKSLHLNSNNFDVFPNLVCFLYSLTFLDLSSNKIKGLPNDLQYLSSTLETLILVDNFIEQLSEGLCLCINLQTLWLGSNNLRSLPKSFKNLNRLDWEKPLVSSCISNNPMQYPPMRVCLKGLNEIINYLDLDTNDEDNS